MAMIVQKRASETAIDELKIVSLEGAMRQSAKKDMRYLFAPPLSRNIGKNQAMSVRNRPRRPVQTCFRGARRMESSHSGPKNSIEDCLQPAAIPSTIALGTINRLSPEYVRQQR